MTEAESKLDPEYIKDGPYLALMGKLRAVFCEDFGENWLRYNGTAMYCDAQVTPNGPTSKCEI